MAQLRNMPNIVMIFRTCETGDVGTCVQCGTCQLTLGSDGKWLNEVGVLVLLGGLSRKVRSALCGIFF